MRLPYRHPTAAVLLALLIGALSAIQTSAAVSIPTSWVDDRGNQPAIVNGFLSIGAVSYPFRMGKTEITNTQYAEFLNAVAASDPVLLYNPSMGNQPWGGINRNGASGSYTYSVKSQYANKPAAYVDIWDAERFANRMHNGQPSGAQGPSTTEDGAYTLLGGASIPSNFNTVARNPNARWFLPSASEWYKAAYYDPRTQAQGGPPGNDHYWLYATRSDSTPVHAQANIISGDVSNPGSNVVTYDQAAEWLPPGERFFLESFTSVGTAGNTSYYGTYDQSGNLQEWSDEDYNGSANSQYRALFGGSWVSDITRMGAQYVTAFGTGDFPNAGYLDAGFRLAMAATNPLPGDFNTDGVVDTGDYIVWRRTFAQSGQGLLADGNNDGKVSGPDYTVWRQNFGRRLTATAGLGASLPIPEPPPVVLVPLVVLILLSATGGRQPSTLSVEKK